MDLDKLENEIIEKCLEFNEYLSFDKKDKACIKEIVEALQQDENILFAYHPGVASLKDATTSTEHTTIVVTEHRMIISGYTDTGVFSSKIIIVNIPVDTNTVVSVVPRHSWLGAFADVQISGAQPIEISTSKKEENKFAQGLYEAIEEAKSRLKSSRSSSIASAPSAADEIMKFKQLLDAGVITQEEFESKKNQLLNL